MYLFYLLMYPSAKNSTWHKDAGNKYLLHEWSQTKQKKNYALFIYMIE